MGADSKIEWTTHTFNHVHGCQKVSPGCANCYAETMSKRNPKVLGVWGPNGTRVVASEAKWREPLAWDRKAKAAGERHRVFCASIADVFEDWAGSMADAKGQFLHTYGGSWPWAPAFEIQPVAGNFRPLTMDDVRRRLWRLILETQNLDWLLLTKRIDVAARWLTDNVYGPAEFGDWTMTGIGGGVVPNVWLGVSVEDQVRADERIPHLLRTPATVRFLSCEPLLGPVDLSRYLACPWCDGSGTIVEHHDYAVERLGCECGGRRFIDWVIVGGESGHGARPCHANWIRHIVQQCRAAGIPAFVKQLGASVRVRNGDPGWPDGLRWDSLLETDWDSPRLRDKKGGDLAEWPSDLRVREIPSVAPRTTEAPSGP